MDGELAEGVWEEGVANANLKGSQGATETKLPGGTARALKHLRGWRSNHGRLCRL